MKKSHVCRIPLIVLLLILFAVAACNEQVRTDVESGSPAVQKEKTVIAQLLIDLQNAFAALNLDKMMTFYSDEYNGRHGQGKEDVRQFVQQMIDQGALAGTEMSIEDIDINIKGDNAVVSPVKYTSGWGRMNIENTLTKENGTWKLISGRQVF